MLNRLPFPEGIWVVDAEFQQLNGDPLPRNVWCVVAKECRSGKTYKLWHDDLRRMDAPPFPTGQDALFVCYSAHAELQTFQALGWPIPVNVFDAMVEGYLCTNRMKVLGIPPAGTRFLHALEYFGLQHRMGAEKKGLQELAKRGGPFSAEEQQDLLHYCHEDVLALEELLPHILRQVAETHLDWDRYLARMLFRGNFMKAASEVQRHGIGVDTKLLALVQDSWKAIRLELIRRLDVYDIYEQGTFKHAKFEAYLRREGIAWRMRTPTGRLATDEDTWKTMATRYPQLHGLRELTSTLDKLKLNSLIIGPDGRHRFYPRPFGSVTSRNQPSNAEGIFGPSTWIRAFISPEEGWVTLYVDWKSQEIAIAAALSGDPNLIADYRSGDFYIGYGTSIGYLPEGANKDTHGAERDLLKSVCLGLGYGMGSEKMAEEMAVDLYVIRKWIRGHRLRYRVFWDWLMDVTASAYARGWIRSRMGWQTTVPERTRPTSVMNWSMQCHGAELLRAAVVMAVKRGLRVTAMVHDAIVLEAPVECWQDHAKALERCMEQASQLILPDGFTIPVDGIDKPVFHDGRYMDERRGRATWELVMEILADVVPESTSVAIPRKKVEPVLARIG